MFKNSIKTKHINKAFKFSIETKGTNIVFKQKTQTKDTYLVSKQRTQTQYQKERHKYSINRTKESTHDTKI